MSSAEVYGWGALLPDPIDEECLDPLAAGRTKLVRGVYAGYGQAILACNDHAKWVGRDSSGYKVMEIGVDSENSLALESAAIGLTHALLLLRKTVARDDVPDTVAKPGSETEVFALGSGLQGQLGLGAKTLETTRPQPIRALSMYQVVQVSCGAHHSAAVTYDGDLFTWGRGFEGQLGHASHNLPLEANDMISGVQFRPKPVSAFLATSKHSRPVATVSCGHKFTVVVTRAGEVWAFGEGALGQLGVGRVTRVIVPMLVMEACPITGEPFVQVAAGWAHTLARTKGGGVFSWGFNGLGSLGLGDNRIRFSPEAIVFGGVDCGVGAGGDIDDDGKGSSVAVAKVDACGNCSGALTFQGELFTWGYNLAGSLGHGNHHNKNQSQAGKDVHVLRPRRVERLAGSVVTDFALSGRGGVALVPLRVKIIEPGSGPLEAGCEIVINGEAFWDSPDIVVKFSPVGKEHKPSAARSAIGTYVAWDKDGGDSGECRNGNERLTCMAPCFASPDEVFVEVAVDGCSFSEDGNRFQYYQTPEIKAITPNRIRPPLPRLRLDGEYICPSDHMMVRFEEQCRRYNGIDDAEVIAPANQNDEPARVFEVPGKVESEMVEVGQDPETELPIEEERWFITCEAPSIGAGVNLPLAYRVTVAPNGVTFRGAPIQFIVHDPFVDACSPTAVPVPVVSCPSAGDDGVEEPEEKGIPISITGRSLYGGADLAVRLHRDLDDFASLDAVAFDPESEAITGVIPAEAEKLFKLDRSSDDKENSQAPAVSVAVEVTIDGEEFFAAPERLILYRDPWLTLKVDGPFPTSGGGFAELVPEAPTFRGDNPQVRLLSETHGLELTLSLLSSPPPRELEHGDEMSPRGKEGRTKARSTLANARKSEALGSQGIEEAGGETARGHSPPRKDGGDDDTMLDGSKPKAIDFPPASADSFFFTVPPLPKDIFISDEEKPPASGLDGATCQRKTVFNKATAEGGPSSDVKMVKDKKGKDAHKDAPEAPESTEESKVTLSVFVSLNGRDWQPARGPPLTYFQPPPEPAETKRGNRKKKH